MNDQTDTSRSFSADETEICALYQQLLEGWNKRSADDMADPFLEDGELIGFDGSQILGRTEIASHNHHREARGEVADCSLSEHPSSVSWKTGFGREDD